MHIGFLNGDSDQWAWTNAAQTQSLFPWDELTTNVQVTYGEPPSDGNEHDEFTVFAYTAILSNLRDPCGRPDAAFMTLRPDLPTFVHDFEGMPPKRHPLDPNATAIDTIHHEFGHILASKLSQESVSRVGKLFGREITTWADEKDLPWQNRCLEAFCETFKDVYLQDNRQWDNRTNLRLSPLKYAQFLDIMDTVCPCTGSWDPGHGQWVWLSAGFGGAWVWEGPIPDPAAQFFFNFLDPSAPANQPIMNAYYSVGPGVPVQYEMGSTFAQTCIFEAVDPADHSKVIYSHRFTLRGNNVRFYYTPDRPVDVRFRSASIPAQANKLFLSLGIIPKGSIKLCARKTRPPWPYGDDGGGAGPPSKPQPGDAHGGGWRMPNSRDDLPPRHDAIIGHNVPEISTTPGRVEEMPPPVFVT